MHIALHLKMHIALQLKKYISQNAHRIASQNAHRIASQNAHFVQNSSLIVLQLKVHTLSKIRIPNFPKSISIGYYQVSISLVSEKDTTGICLNTNDTFLACMVKEIKIKIKIKTKTTKILSSIFSPNKCILGPIGQGRDQPNMFDIFMSIGVVS